MRTLGAQKTLLTSIFGLEGCRREERVETGRAVVGIDHLLAAGLAYETLAAFAGAEIELGGRAHRPAATGGIYCKLGNSLLLTVKL